MHASSSCSWHPSSMTKSVAIHSCYGCDYLGPAEVVDVHVLCPECEARVLHGSWIDYACKECGFTGIAFTPPDPGLIPCHDCGILN